jgi:dTDP-4-dehydrorhamnose reductase
MRTIKPELIVHAAALRGVDRAEDEPVMARVVNSTAPAIIAEEARKIGAVVVHYSTDYVFDGDKKDPHEESDLPRPLNVYGATKLEGERGITAAGIPHIILRTSWVYGADGSNFMRTILKISHDEEELRVVSNQVDASTWSRSIAKMTVAVLDACSKYG